MRDKHLPFGPGASSFLGVHGPGKHLSLGVRAPGWLQSPRMPGSLRSTVGGEPEGGDQGHRRGTPTLFSGEQGRHVAANSCVNQPLRLKLFPLLTECDTVPDKPDTVDGAGWETGVEGVMG